MARHPVPNAAQVIAVSSWRCRRSERQRQPRQPPRTVRFALMSSSIQGTGAYRARDCCPPVAQVFMLDGPRISSSSITSCSTASPPDNSPTSAMVDRKRPAPVPRGSAQGYPQPGAGRTAGAGTVGPLRPVERRTRPAVDRAPAPPVGNGSPVPMVACLLVIWSHGSWLPCLSGATGRPRRRPLPVPLRPADTLGLPRSR